jgi:CRP-like cAMP-binding protein
MRPYHTLLAATFARVPMMQHLRPELRRALVAATRYREYPVDAEITRAGETADGLLVILDGNVVVASDGDPPMLGAGDFLDELAPWDVLAAGATTHAVTSVRAAILRTVDAFGVIRATPDLALALVRAATSRLRSMDDGARLPTASLLQEQVFQYASDFCELVERERSAAVQLRESVMSSVRGLVALAEGHVPGSMQHGANVGRRARAIAEQLDLGEEFATHALLGGVLHDVGIALLTPAGTSWRALPGHSLREHPTKGVELIAGSSALAPVVPFILEHHEMLDGTGYPRRSRGANIGLPGRVMAVAELYEETLRALRAKSPNPSGDALASLCRMAGRELDGGVIAALKASLTTCAGALGAEDR